MEALFKKEKLKKNLTIAAAAIGCGTLLWLAFGLGDKKPKITADIPQVNVIKKSETFEEGFRSRFSNDMLSLQDSNKTIRKNLEDLHKKTAALEEENKKLKENMDTANNMKLPPPIDRPLSEHEQKIPPAPNTIIEASNNETNAAPQVTVLTGLIAVGKPIRGEPEIDKIKKIVTKPAKDLIIPAGSFVKATLLSGVIAPTMGKGANDPVPVLLRITGFAKLPNFFFANIKSCFLLAETKGNLATETVSFRLKSLACKKSDGTTIEKTVDGYVTGENGIEGVPGRVVSKQGALIARAFAAEFLGGISTAFEEAGQTVSTTASGVISTLNPNKTLQTGLFAGASGAFTRVSDFYMDLADNMVPVIEIAAGRNIDVVFIKPVNLGDTAEGQQ